MEPSGCAGSGGGGCEMDVCEHCAAWREHCYWNHPAGGKRQFIIRASDGFRDGVCIPPEAASQLRDMIPHSEPIQLEAPDGHIYTVEFMMFFGISLTTGWRKFVDANHIQEGDSILFLYCENSRFKVHIFSSSGHESSQQPPGIFTAVPPCHPRDHHVLNEQVVPDPAHVQTSTDFGYSMFPGTCMTREQENKVRQLVDSMSSELHVAAVNKGDGNEDCYVLIPLKLLDNFKEGKTEVTIQLEAHDNKNYYFVGARKHSDERIILQSALSTFVASHRIQEDDLLVFRSKGKAHLEVLVLDPSGCERTSSFVMGDSSNAREVREDSVEILEPTPPTVIEVSSDDDEVVGKDTTMSRREQSSLQVCHAKAQKMASTSSPCAKSEYEAGKSKEAGQEVPVSNKLKSPYILPKGKNLTSQQEEKVKEKVLGIGSEFPVFVKVMTKEEVSRALNICVEYTSVCRLPPKQTPLLLGLEGSDMQWSTTLSPMNHGTTRRICSFWKDIVSHAGMKPGDILLVELADRSIERLRMTVHLIRESEMQV